MLIGVSGKAGVGKTTFSEMLCKELIDVTGKPWQTYALASKVKDSVIYLFGWDERCSDGILKEQEIYSRFVYFQDVANFIQETFGDYVEDFLSCFQEYVCYASVEGFQVYMSPRKAYQIFGTEFGRICINDNIWVDVAPKEYTIWSDVRFQNEAEAVFDNKGWNIRIEGRNTTTDHTGHSSEAGFEEELVDVFIGNSGSKEDLEAEAKQLAKIIKLQMEK